jgi:hypothetical protein
LIPFIVAGFNGKNDGINELVHRSITALMDGSPKKSTKTTSSR